VLSQNNHAFLELDSWQKTLSLKIGSGEYLSSELGLRGRKSRILATCVLISLLRPPIRLEELLRLALRV